MDRAALAFGPAEIGLWRMTSGAATLAAYCLYTRKWSWLTPTEWRQLAIVAFFCNAYPYVVQPFAMQSTGEHGFIGMMVTLVPIATIAAVALMLRQWPTPRQWIGVLGGLGCAALIVFDGSERGIAPWLLAMALSSPVSYAIGNTYLKWKLAHLPTAPLTVLFLLMGAAFVVPFEFIPPLRDALHLGPPAEPQQFSFAPQLAAAPRRRQHRRRDLALRLARPNAGPPLRRHGHLRRPDDRPPLGPIRWRTPHQPPTRRHRRGPRDGRHRPVASGETDRRAAPPNLPPDGSVSLLASRKLAAAPRDHRSRLFSVIQHLATRSSAFLCPTPG